METTKRPRETTIGKVVAMLWRNGGASLDEMVEGTGWLPHTMRAALTGLKKKGHTIEREGRSLSEVAHAITATRRSGPAFFGLRQKRTAARQQRLLDQPGREARLPVAGDR